MSSSTPLPSPLIPLLAVNNVVVANHTQTNLLWKVIFFKWVNIYWPPMRDGLWQVLKAWSHSSRSTWKVCAVSLQALPIKCLAINFANCHIKKFLRYLSNGECLQGEYSDNFSDQKYLYLAEIWSRMPTEGSGVSPSLASKILLFVPSVTFWCEAAACIGFGVYHAH